MSVEMDYDIHNYNFSRQQNLTQQTSTNASQDLDILHQQNCYQDQSIINKSRRGRSSYQRNSEILSAHNKNRSNQQEESQQQSQQFYEFTEVFVWGDDRCGQLGLYHQKVKKGNKDQTSFKLPKTCSFNILIKQISCGDSHSAILTNQGHLYMMGSNYDGQLGIGDNNSDLLNQDRAGAPCLVDRLRDYKVQSVECGQNFTFAVVQEKSSHLNNNQQIIFGWGNNKEGQLGISTHHQLNVPTRIHFFEPLNIQIKQIRAGLSHTLFLTEQGHVYATGSNLQGQLGIGQQCNQVIQPILINELKDLEIIQASAGDHHSLFLTSKGEVYACGNNQLCQLGLPDVHTIQYIPSQIKSLQNYKIVKVEAKQESAAISSSGELFLWGSGVFGTYKTPQKILTISNPVCDVSLGSSLGTALDNKGLLWTWGQNQTGELGVGDNDPRIHPYPVLTLKGKKVTQIQCGGSFVVALGVNMKKEIPQLKLKKQRESSQAAVNANKINSQILRNSSQKSLGNRSQSQGKKKKLTTSSKQQRKDSIASLNKIYGMGQQPYNDNDRLNSDAHSPRMSKDIKLTKILKKKNSKSSLNKSKLQDSIPRQPKTKIKLKKSQSKTKPTQPFCGEETTIIKHGFLNQSCLIVKNKNKLSLVQGFNQQQQQQQLLNQNQTQISTAEQSKHQSKDTFNIEPINSSNHDITNDSTQNIALMNLSSQQNSGKHQQQQHSAQVMYTPQPVQSMTNKEKLIKDLHSEIKQLRTENEILRKENRTVKQQMENQEKHFEKLNLAQQHQQEVQNLYAEIHRLEQKVKLVKQEKNDFKQKYESTEQQLQDQQNVNNDLRDENQELINQVQLIQDEYKCLQDKYQESQCRNEEYESEIQDIQNEIYQINQQSQNVEKSLLEKLQKMSEKFQDSLKQIEELNNQIKTDKKKLDDYAFSAKDTQFYVNALEKENTFLRQEVEKVKYNKDKDQYGKFLQNLIPIRNASKKSYSNNNTSTDNEENTLKQSQISQQNNRQTQNCYNKSPFKDNTTTVCNYDYYHDKEKQLQQLHSDKSSANKNQGATVDEPQILKSSQQQQLDSSVDFRRSYMSDDRKDNNDDKENDSNAKKETVDYNELRMSYNQKLLKSLEKKTLNKFR